MINLEPRRLLTALTRSEGEAYCRQKARYRYLGAGVGIATVLGAYRTFVNTKDPAIVPYLIMDGFWEYWNTQFFAHYVQPGWTVVEVGANLGYFTLLLADLVGPAGRIIAFEPLSTNFELLRRSIAVNGFADRVDCQRVALSNQSGRGAITLDPMNYGGGSILRPSGKGLITEEIDLRRADEAITLSGPVCFKIDAEGAEEIVFEGMAGLLPALSDVRIIMEFEKSRFSDWRKWVSSRREDGFTVSIIGYDGHARQVETEELAALPMIELVLERF